MRRSYRIQLDVTVTDDHEAFHDPDWLAGAAWRALTSLYGLECTYGPSELIDEDATPAAEPLEP